MDANLTEDHSVRVVHFLDIASVGRTMVDGLTALGVEARLVAPAEPGRALPQPWRGLTFPLRVASLLAAGLSIRGDDPDIVHAHYAWKALAAFPAGRPLVVHCHGTDVRGISRSSARGMLLAAVLPRASRVYLATPDLGRWVWPIVPSATFLPNPIDTGSFRPSNEPATRDLLVGLRLDPIKGLDAVVEALRSVIQARPVTTVTVVAQGAGVTAAMVAAGPRASLAAPVPRHDLPALYRAHRVAFGQARVGAIGNYELEALACGLPVAAAFRYPDAYDVPPPLLPFDTPQAAAEAIVALLDDEPRRLALGAEGARWVAERHGRGRIARQLLTDYEAIIAGR